VEGNGSVEERRVSYLRSVVFAWAICLAGCSMDAVIPNCGSPIEPSAEMSRVIARYDNWLSSTQLLYSELSPRDGTIVFVTDRRAHPQDGFSHIYLSSLPNRPLYLYGRNSFITAPLFSDGLAPIMVPFLGRSARHLVPLRTWGPRWAYIDASGHFAFSRRFAAANLFDRGVATAALFPNVPAGSKPQRYQWVLVRKDGTIKTLDRSIVSMENFSGPFAVFYKLDPRATRRPRRYGYLDHAGKIAVPAVFLLARPFCDDGNAAVKTDTGWGLIDIRGKFVIAPKYADIHCFSEGLAAARIGKFGKWGFIDASQRFVIPPSFDAVGTYMPPEFGPMYTSLYVVGDFSDGRAPVMINPPSDGTQSFPVKYYYGFIDRAGAIVVPPAWAIANPYKFGITKFGIQKYFILSPDNPQYTCWSYLDRSGKVVAADAKPQ
jgi:hypothetical protein